MDVTAHFLRMASMLGLADINGVATKYVIPLHHNADLRYFCG